MKLEDLPVWAQILIVVVIAIALVVVAHVYKFSDMQKSIERKNDQLAKLLSENNKNAAIEARLPEFEAEIKRLEERLSVLVQILPTTLEIDVIVSKIKGVADTYNLQILSLTPKPLANKGIYSEYAIAFKVRGTYHSLAMFFDKLSKMERIVNVAGLNIRRAKGRGSGPNITVEASYTASTYVYQG
ncbi:MAG: type 4a pilus biogenesis protein PilO [Acidobacteriota bacterium]|nr:MAG: type 4a pilus biogenesis protein PilO [Acidobacteriota bacterium]